MTDIFFTVRTALPTHHTAEAAVIGRAFEAGPYGHLPKTPERDAFERDSVGRAGGGRLLVAVDGDDRVIGSASVLRADSGYVRVARPGEAEIRLLAVDPSAQGAGVGEALMRASLETALGWGSDALVLDTGSLNVRAQALYARLGFDRVPERDADVPVDGIPPYVYRHGLQGAADVRVRLMQADEADDVAVLAERAYSSDYTLSDGYRSSIIAMGERAREHQVWVAVDEASGELIGTVSTPRAGRAISPLAAAGELDFRLLGVDPAARRRGIGRLLTRHVLLLARIRGVRRVVMNSGPEMLAAHRLYGELGFSRLRDREPTIERADGTGFRLLTFGYDVAAAALPGARD